MSVAGRSRALRICCLARLTSSAVTPLAPIPSTVASRMSRTSSSELSRVTWAVIIINPGSCSARAEAEALEAFLVSTSALYNRPEGWLLRMLASTSSAAESSCGPAGT